MGEAGAGGAGAVRGVDGGGSSEARRISRSAFRQERAGGAARRESRHLVTVSVRALLPLEPLPLHTHSVVTPA